MIGNAYANDFFAAPKKVQTKTSSGHYRPEVTRDRSAGSPMLNFFSYDYKSGTE